MRLMPYAPAVGCQSPAKKLRSPTLWTSGAPSRKMKKVIDASIAMLLSASEQQAPRDDLVRDAHPPDHDPERGGSSPSRRVSSRPSGPVTQSMKRARVGGPVVRDHEQERADQRVPAGVDRSPRWRRRRRA